MVKARQPSLDKMENDGTQYGCCNVNKDSGSISCGGGNISKDNLFHFTVRTDIKKVDIPEWVQQNIQPGGGCAADKIEQNAVKTILSAVGILRAVSRHDSYEYEKEMPQKGMQGKGEIAVMHSACVKKSKNSA